MDIIVVRINTVVLTIMYFFFAECLIKAALQLQPTVLQNADAGSCLIDGRSKVANCQKIFNKARPAFVFCWGCSQFKFIP